MEQSCCFQAANVSSRGNAGVMHHEKIPRFQAEIVGFIR
jgi:hypothetical protein